MWHHELVLPNLVRPYRGFLSQQSLHTHAIALMACVAVLMDISAAKHIGGAQMPCVGGLPPLWLVHKSTLFKAERADGIT